MVYFRVKERAFCSFSFMVCAFLEGGAAPLQTSPQLPPQNARKLQPFLMFLPFHVHSRKPCKSRTHYQKSWPKKKNTTPVKSKTNPKSNPGPSSKTHVSFSPVLSRGQVETPSQVRGSPPTFGSSMFQLGPVIPPPPSGATTSQVCHLEASRSTIIAVVKVRQER